MNQLIHCIDCDAVHLKTSYDQEPEYESASFLSPYLSLATERDDFGDFMKDHDGHRLEDLTFVEDSFLSDQPYIEPVKVSYFKATNGKENFVIRRFRERIGEPLRYELLAGDYSLTCVSLEVQRRELENQLMREFKDSPLPKNKIDSFIKLYDHIIKTVDIAKLDRVSEESPHPLEVFYKMDDVTLMYLLRNCHNIFKGKEYSAVEKFIDRHKEDGVLLLKATYRIRITQRAQAQKKVMREQMALERERVKELG